MCNRQNELNHDFRNSPAASPLTAMSSFELPVVTTVPTSLPIGSSSLGINCRSCTLGNFSEKHVQHLVKRHESNYLLQLDGSFFEVAQVAQ